MLCLDLQENAGDSPSILKDSSPAKRSKEINKILQYYRGYIMINHKTGI
jgi:hypothetical protein